MWDSFFWALVGFLTLICVGLGMVSWMDHGLVKTVKKSEKNRLRRLTWFLEGGGVALVLVMRRSLWSGVAKSSRLVLRSF